jgi:hypothetical protein
MKPATEMLEEGIRKCAYHLWEASGRPHGRDLEFWERAREQLAIEGNRSAGKLADVIIRGSNPAPAKPGRKRATVPDRTTDRGEGQSATPRRRRKT